MPSNYVSNRAKVQNIIETILKNVEDRDLDYISIVDFVAFESKTSIKKVQEVLDLTIKTKNYIVTDDGIITLSDKQIPDWLKKYKEKEKKMLEADQEMQKIVNSAKTGGGEMDR